MVSRIRSFLFQNWIPKITCLIIAIGLWFWVAIQQTGRSQFRVPIEFINKPDTLFVTDESDRSVSIVLQGPKTALYQTSASDLVAQLNLRGQSQGTKVFWSSELTFRKPNTLEVYEVSPRKLRITLEQRTESKVQVSSKVEGSAPEGYEYRVNVSPETATIFGTDQVVQSVRQLSLKPIKLSNREPGTTTFSRSVQLPEGTRLKTPENNSFEVTLEIFPEQITRELQTIPVTVTDVPAGMKAVVEPSTMSLTVRGPKTTVENLQPSDINVTVKAPEKGSGLVIRVPEVNLPGDVEIVDGEQTVSALKVKLESQ